MARHAEPQVALGRVIATRREELGLKQEQLALAVGTDQARISRIENAGDNPSYGLVERIAKALELELWELAKQAGEARDQRLSGFGFAAIEPRSNFYPSLGSLGYRWRSRKARWAFSRWAL